VSLGQSRQHRQVEVDDVPAREDVGVELTDPARKAGEQLLLCGKRRRVRWTTPARGRQEQHLGDAAAVQSHGQQAARGRIGLDVEREDAQPRRPIRGHELWLIEHDAEALKLTSFATDLAAPADPAVDEIAHGETDVGLVRRDARSDQPIAQARSVRGIVHLDADGGLTGERDPVGRNLPSGAAPARRFGILLLDVEMRNQAALAHQERPPVFQPAVEMDHGPIGLDAIRRLQDEAAMRCHGPSESALTSRREAAARCPPGGTRPRCLRPAERYVRDQPWRRSPRSPAPRSPRP
jgi:hypothetical protein